MPTKRKRRRRKSLIDKLRQCPKLGMQTTATFSIKRHDTHCRLCGRSFCVGDKVTSVEVQVDFFRGNDEVEYVCDTCANEHEHNMLESITRKWAENEKS